MEAAVKQKVTEAVTLGMLFPSCIRHVRGVCVVMFGSPLETRQDENGGLTYVVVDRSPKRSASLTGRSGKYCDIGKK